MIYIIMCGEDIFESTYYTDEEAIAKRVEYLREHVGTHYWYKKFHKA